MPPLADLIPEVETDILGGLDPGLYIWDNYEGEPICSRSLAESDKLREEAEAKREET